MNIYGTIEKIGGCPQSVHYGTSRTFDYNNGVVVIYDENGRPWIKRREDFLDEQVRTIFGPDYFTHGVNPNGFSRGGHVPHSNDGGHYVLELFQAA